jgi:serine/threonine protein kinase
MTRAETNLDYLRSHGKSGTAVGTTGSDRTKDEVCESAFWEYLERVQTGEQLDPEEFASRFPAHRSDLLNILVAHEYFEEHPDHLSTADARDSRTNYPQPGESWLGFRLLSVLGKGAFACVYLAEEPEVGGRLVVLKISKESFAEAQTLGRLEHRNIVPVHSAWKDPARGLSAFCMPFLGRATLGDVQEKAFSGGCPPRGADAFRAAVAEGSFHGLEKTLPARQAAFGNCSYIDAVLEIACQLAEALAFVHSRGILHRDLKPSNVLLSSDGRPMLLDFNLSRDPRLAKDRFGGTIPYMSPEQLRLLRKDPSAESPGLDGRSDLYSLGVVLYELLTGTHPFGPLHVFRDPGVLAPELLARQSQQFVPLRKRNPNVDHTLEQIIARCLAFEPRERFASADELANAVKRCQSITHRALRWAKQRRPVLCAVGLTVLLALAAAGAVRTQLQPPASQQFDQGMKEYKDRDYARAIELLTGAVDQPSPPVDGYYYRGRAYLHLDPPDYQRAADDFCRAAELADADPESKAGYGKAIACAAYCYGKLSAIDPTHYQEYALKTIAYCRKAVDAGFAKAVMLNNLGFFEARQPGRSEEALRCLEEAVRLDESLQVAHQNIARIELDKVLRYGQRGYLPDRGIRAVEAALTCGPANPELLHEAACLYALAHQADPQQRKSLNCATAALRQLAERGWLTRQLVSDGLLQEVRAELGLAIRESDLRDRSQVPIPRLFCDPAED